MQQVPQPPILAAEQRAWNYWFVDGLTNLVVGANTMIMAFCLFNPMRWLPRPVAVALSLMTMVLYVVIGTHYRHILEWLKTKVTYPRTGYVDATSLDSGVAPSLVTVSLNTPPEAQMLRMQRRTRWMICVALAAVASFSFIVIHDRWAWTGAGFLFSVAMIVARKDFRISWIPPVGFPILGLAITAFAPVHMGPAIFITGLGLLLVLDGATTLICYLIRNPRPKAPTA